MEEVAVGAAAAAAAVLAASPLSSFTERGVCKEDALAEFVAAASGSTCNCPFCTILAYTSRSCWVV